MLPALVNPVLPVGHGKLDFLLSLLLLILGNRLRSLRFDQDILFRHSVETGKIIIFNQFDKFGRIRSIPGFFQAVRPGLVVGRLVLEKEFVTVPVSQEVRMVTERFLGGIVDPEALSLFIIVIRHVLPFPVMTFYSKMIVPLGGER